MTLLAVDGLRKSFGGVRALDTVDLEVLPGEVHALLGGNGAGKSTILKVLNGVHVPDDGTVEVAGHKLAAATPEADAAVKPALLSIEGVFGAGDLNVEYILIRNLSGSGVNLNGWSVSSGSGLSFTLPYLGVPTE